MVLTEGPVDKLMEPPFTFQRQSFLAEVIGSSPVCAAMHATI